MAALTTLTACMVEQANNDVTSHFELLFCTGVCTDEILCVILPKLTDASVSVHAHLHR